MRMVVPNSDGDMLAVKNQLNRRNLCGDYRLQSPQPERGVLIKNEAGGRSTSYALAGEVPKVEPPT